MKLRFILCLVLLGVFILKADNMFQSFRLYPSISDRAFWGKVAKLPGKSELIKKIFADADEAMTSPIPECRASLFMQFNRNGNRKNYEEQYSIIMDYIKNFRISRIVIDATREASLGQRIQANVKCDILTLREVT